MDYPVARAGPRRPFLAGLRDCAGLFTVFPAGSRPGLSRADGARAVRWLPVVGVALSLPAAGVLLGVEAGHHSAARNLLAATLAVALLALLTGGLHLDGLADTADGLASRRPREEALALMRRSDTGPLGVAVLVFALLIQVTALAALGAGWWPAVALLAAVVTGRAAVVAATGAGSPAARPDGFGALVAGATPMSAIVVTVAALLAYVGGVAYAVGGVGMLERAVGASVLGLLTAELLRRAARQRLGGMTGDVYGALVETATTMVLLAAVLAR